MFNNTRMIYCFHSQRLSTYKIFLLFFVSHISSGSTILSVHKQLSEKQTRNEGSQVKTDSIIFTKFEFTLGIKSDIEEVKRFNPQFNVMSTKDVNDDKRIQLVDFGLIKKSANFQNLFFLKKPCLKYVKLEREPQKLFLHLKIENSVYFFIPLNLKHHRILINSPRVVLFCHIFSTSSSDIDGEKIYADLLLEIIWRDIFANLPTNPIQHETFSTFKSFLNMISSNSDKLRRLKEFSLKINHNAIAYSDMISSNSDKLRRLKEFSLKINHNSIAYSDMISSNSDKLRRLKEFSLKINHNAIAHYLLNSNTYRYRFCEIKNLIKVLQEMDYSKNDKFTTIILKTILELKYVFKNSICEFLSPLSVLNIKNRLVLCRFSPCSNMRFNQCPYVYSNDLWCSKIYKRCGLYFITIHCNVVPKFWQKSVKLNTNAICSLAISASFSFKILLLNYNSLNITAAQCCNDLVPIIFKALLYRYCSSTNNILYSVCNQNPIFNLLPKILGNNFKPFYFIEGSSRYICSNELKSTASFPLQDICSNELKSTASFHLQDIRIFESYDDNQLYSKFGITLTISNLRILSQLIHSITSLNYSENISRYYSISDFVAYYKFRSYTLTQNLITAATFLKYLEKMKKRNTIEKRDVQAIELLIKELKNNRANNIPQVENILMKICLINKKPDRDSESKQSDSENILVHGYRLKNNTFKDLEIKKSGCENTFIHDFRHKKKLFTDFNENLSESDHILMDNYWFNSNYVENFKRNNLIVHPTNSHLPITFCDFNSEDVYMECKWIPHNSRPKKANILHTVNKNLVKSLKISISKAQYCCISTYDEYFQYHIKNVPIKSKNAKKIDGFYNINN